MAKNQGFWAVVANFATTALTLFQSSEMLFTILTFNYSHGTINRALHQSETTA